MKTSTKIFILALVCVPVSLFAYNALLKARYIAGNFAPVKNSGTRRNDADDFVNINLPRFKYVVVNGMMTSGIAGKGGQESWTNHPNIDIDGDSTKVPFARVNKFFQSLYRTKVVTDTLYISFYREKPIGNISITDDQLLSLHLNSNTEYIRGEAARVDIEGTFNPQQLTVAAAGAGIITLNKLNADQINIIARDSCMFNIREVRHTSTLFYTMLGESKLDVQHSNIKTYKPMRVDSGVQMNVTIWGAAIQKYLEGGQQ